MRAIVVDDYPPFLTALTSLLGGKNGIEVARKLKSAPGAPKVIVMSFHAEPEYRDMALQAGADAFLVKTEIHQELVPLLRRITG